MSKKIFLAWAFFAGSIAAAAPSTAPLRVIEASAIPYARFLAKADFDQRFPGELKPAAAALDSGWYVIYQHQGLNYYFGPILLESTGKDYLAQLRTTVEAAVAQRPSIRDYRLALRYEPAAPSSDQSPASAAPAPPEPRSGLWGWIKRVFRF